jgi:hypothetical protein
MIGDERCPRNNQNSKRISFAFTRMLAISKIFSLHLAFILSQNPRG